MFPQGSACQCPCPRRGRSPALPGWEPSARWGALASGPAAGPVGAAWTLIGPYCCVCLPAGSTAARARVFSLWEHALSFHIFHRHRMHLVNQVDLTFSLCSWWKAPQSSPLATPRLELSCGFSPTSECGPAMGVCSWGSPGGLGSLPQWGEGVQAACLPESWGAQWC